MSSISIPAIGMDFGFNTLTNPLSIAIGILTNDAMKERCDRLMESTFNSDIDRVDILNTLKGDEEAFARLIKRYEQLIAAQMWRFSRDPLIHQELVQDVFVEAFQSLHSYRERAPFLHWLRRIASRTGYRFWKRKARDRERSLQLETDLRDDPLTNEVTTPSEAAEYLFRVFEKLPAAERMILTLHYLEGFDMHEIAQQMGWNYTLVKVRAFRARKKLKKMMIQAGFKEVNDE